MSRGYALLYFGAGALLFGLLTVSWHITTQDLPWPIHIAVVAFGIVLTAAALLMGLHVILHPRREP